MDQQITLKTDERKCKSCSAIIKKEAYICPKCGVPFKASGKARLAFWISLIFGMIGLLAGFMGSCATSCARAFGESHMDVEIASVILFWGAFPAIIGGFKIKKSKPLGWKLMMGASIAMVFATLINPQWDPILWVVAYGIATWLGYKDIKEQ